MVSSFSLRVTYVTWCYKLHESVMVVIVIVFFFFENVLILHIGYWPSIIYTVSILQIWNHEFHLKFYHLAYSTLWRFACNDELSLFLIVTNIYIYILSCIQKDYWRTARRVRDCCNCNYLRTDIQGNLFKECGVIVNNMFSIAFRHVNPSACISYSHWH
jgi:hypothetical protein